MVTGADKNGVVATAASDVRITRVGRLLRSLKVDEFFQQEPYPMDLLR